LLRVSRDYELRPIRMPIGCRGKERGRRAQAAPGQARRPGFAGERVALLGPSAAMTNGTPDGSAADGRGGPPVAALTTPAIGDKKFRNCHRPIARTDHEHAAA